MLEANTKFCAPTETNDSTYRSSETSTKNSEVERNSICNSSTFKTDSKERDYPNDIYLANRSFHANIYVTSNILEQH